MFTACASRFPTTCHRLFVLLSILAFNFFLATSAHAAEYYLSPSGNDSNPGTLAAPWKTLDRLQKEQKNLQPGDTVYFRGGEYVIDDSAKKSYYLWRGGTESAPVTYRNYQGEKPWIIYDRRNIGAGVGQLMINLYSNYAIIDGLNFRQTEGSRELGISGNQPDRIQNVRAFRIEGSNVTIRNCAIENFSGPGMNIAGSNLLVEHCSLTGQGGHGFYISGSNGTYRYNILDGSRGYSNQQGINIQYRAAHGNKIYGNLLKNGQATGVVFSGRVANNEVFNNVFINAGSKPPKTPGKDTIGSVVGFWCEDGPVGPGNKFYNNTAIGKTNSELVAGGWCQNTEPGKPLGRNVEIYNNIFYPSTPVRVGLTTPNVHDNIFYNIPGSGPPGNTVVNPMLANPSGGAGADAMLLAGSPAIDKAIAGFPINDYQGGRRPFPAGGLADIGAFEFGAPPGQEAGPLGGGDVGSSGPILRGPNGEICPAGYN